jgi:polyferredoxin
MPTEVCEPAVLKSESVNAGCLVAKEQKPNRKKKFIRRANRDYSQGLRHGFQSAFLLLNVWLGGEFYLWVRQLEDGASRLSVARPAGVEGWLPIAGIMNFKFWLSTGHVPAIHPAAMFLLLAFVAIAFLFRKAFCSWLCPIGTLSEYLWRAGRKAFGRNFRVPSWLDIPLRGLKYLLLGFFIWAVAGMSALAIQGFMQGPYGLIADVKMLDFFRFLGTTGLIVIGTLALASVFIQNFWCRYLCPYGALLGLVSRWSPLKIRRNQDACIDCGKCAKACPARVPVDKLLRVRSPECTACLECVAVCPAEGALGLSWPESLAGRRNKRAMPAWAMGLAIAALFLGIVGFAKTAGHWQSYVPMSVYKQLIPRANQIAHPMPGDQPPVPQ